ncbi:d518b934-6f69-4895-b448-2939b611c5c5 [Thermothielavioides terrestris]|uniref:D518b934-6f69-4895-b448-2939b611c5c5 n=1 Tax=Thermothielavioides terrestris TaxID=2587410 RepID=A0A446BS62_9PEZI|nr:d518b934-6f69-4895-b448-2939b611c5c5 [Thermothielavioides terrestris]
MMPRVFKALALCVAFVDSALAQITESASIVYVSGCAAVVSTTDVCSTCLTIDCVVPATITAGCDGCPTAAPTVYRSFPCDQGCNVVGCKTVYTVVTATDGVCDEDEPSSSAESPSSTAFEESAGPTTTAPTLTETPANASSAGKVASLSSSRAAAARFTPFWHW